MSQSFRMITRPSVMWFQPPSSPVLLLCILTTWNLFSSPNAHYCAHLPAFAWAFLDSWNALPLIYLFFTPCLPIRYLHQPVYPLLTLFYFCSWLLLVISCHTIHKYIYFSYLTLMSESTFCHFLTCCIAETLICEPRTRTHIFLNLCSNQLVIFTNTKICSATQRVYPFLLVNPNFILPLRLVKILLPSRLLPWQSSS